MRDKGVVVCGPICGSSPYDFLHSSVCLKRFVIKTLLEAQDLRPLEIPPALPVFNSSQKLRVFKYQCSPSLIREESSVSRKSYFRRS